MLHFFQNILQGIIKQKNRLFGKSDPDSLEYSDAYSAYTPTEHYIPQEEHHDPIAPNPELQAALHSILIDYPAFPFKPRQKYLTEKGFHEYKKYLVGCIRTLIIYREDEASFSIFSGSYIYEWLMLHYTAGAPIDTILNMMKVYQSIAESIFSRYDFDWQKLTYQDIQEIKYNTSLPNKGPFMASLVHSLGSIAAINPMAIAGFTRYDENIIKSMYVHLFLLTDRGQSEDDVIFDTDMLSEALMRFFMHSNQIPHAPRMEDLNIPEDDLRIDLYKAMMATNPKEIHAHLEKFLENWVTIKCIDSASPLTKTTLSGHEACNGSDFHGYWAFEAAVVAYLKNIDDTAFHKFFYYPIDFVQHFRGKPNLVTPAADSYDQYTLEEEDYYALVAEEDFDDDFDEEEDSVEAPYEQIEEKERWKRK